MARLAAGIWSEFPATWTPIQRCWVDNRFMQHRLNGTPSAKISSCLNGLAYVLSVAAVMFAVGGTVIVLTDSSFFEAAFQGTLVLFVSAVISALASRRWDTFAYVLFMAFSSLTAMYVFAAISSFANYFNGR